MTLFEKPILFTYFRSSCAHRVRLALNLKGIPYESRFIHLVKDGGEQHKTDYKNLNPKEEVPYFIHGEKAMAQSSSIIRYIDHTWPDFPLYPSDFYLKIKADEYCQIINSGIQPLQNLSVLNYLEKELSVSSDQKIKWAQHFISRGLMALECELKKYSGTYALGNAITIVDLFLIPQMKTSLRFQIPLENYPRLFDIYQACLSLPAFIESSPEHQQDFSA
jgi:maleylacetoacetate isomerase